MRAFPRSRRSRTTAAVLLVLLLAAAWVKRDEITFLAKLVLPGRTYAQAERRTSGPAEEGEALALPVASAPSGATGEAPALAVAGGIPLPGASALADPTGPGPVLVTTLDGLVHAVNLETGEATIVLDIGNRTSAEGERGLLGIAVDPDDARMYLNFTNARGDTEIRSWALDGDGLPIESDELLHLEIGQPFENHNGGNLVFGPDGALWIGTGDGGGGGDAGEVAQDDSSLLGKMLRVLPNPDGGLFAPSTNPSWDRPEIWGIGLRNPWRYSFDRETGRLWIADVGQNTIEEVTVIDGDADHPNFGWDTVEGANDYEGTSDPSFTAPVVTYNHDEGCSITGGYVYRGEAIPRLYGWYLFADYCTGFIRAVPADDPTATPMVLATDLGNIVSFGELENGELILLTAAGLQPILPG